MLQNFVRMKAIAKQVVLICVLIFCVGLTCLLAQYEKPYRFSIEFGMGASTYEDAYGDWPALALNCALLLRTQKNNLFSVDVAESLRPEFSVFGAKKPDSFFDVNFLYGKAIPFRRAYRGYFSLQGGVGYAKLFREAYRTPPVKKETIDFMLQAKTSFSYRGGDFGFVP